MRPFCNFVHFHCDLLSFTIGGTNRTEHHCNHPCGSSRCVVVAFPLGWHAVGFELPAKTAFCGVHCACNLCSNEHQRRKCVLRCKPSHHRQRQRRRVIRQFRPWVVGLHLLPWSFLPWLPWPFSDQ